MAVSAMGVTKLAARLKVLSFLSGNASAGVQISWQDIRDFGELLFIATAAVLTGTGITGFEVWAATSSTGTNATQLRVHALANTPYAAGSQISIEAIAAEIEQLGSNFRYISIKLTTNNAADNILVTYILGKARFPQDQLTIKN